MKLWKQHREAILPDLAASMTTARAFLDFSGSELGRRYKELREECAGVALLCLDAAEKILPAADRKNRFLVSKWLLEAATIQRAMGRRNESKALQDRALTLLTTVTASGTVPRGAFLELGRLHSTLVSRDPGQAEDHLARAAKAYEKSGNLSGWSGKLCLTLGETRRTIALRLEVRLEGNAGSRRLKVAVEEAWEAAINTFQKGLKLEKGDRKLTTAYNESLWELKRLTEGKYRGKPLGGPRKLRHGRLRITFPTSTRWQILGESDFSRYDEILDALKVDTRRGGYLRILIDQYYWRRAFKVEGTEISVQGDDIEGLALHAEPLVRGHFEEVTEEIPTKKAPLNGKFPDALVFTVRGKVEGGAIREYRSIFVKSRWAQFTYRISVIADPGTLTKYPHELDYILSTLEPNLRK